MPNFRIVYAPRFESEARNLLGPFWDGFNEALTWTLRRRPEMGQRISGSQKRVWPYYPGDGHVYIVYYSIAENQVRVSAVTQRVVPVSPKMFGLDE